MPTPKVYLAAPFFTPEQLSFVEKLEDMIATKGYSLFSPRLGSNAKIMNEMFKRKQQPTADLRLKVFTDNWVNIDDADLIVAFIDDFDVGVMWEIGYAFARQVPIVTVTNHNYGCNLMLAESIIGHAKSLESLCDILSIAMDNISINEEFTDYGRAVATIQAKYKTPIALKEGPDERNQH